MDLIHLLHAKALSKRGYSWTGKFLSSLLLTLTHTYPLENKFINPEQWTSEGGSSLWLLLACLIFNKEFRRNHHRHWGQLFAPDEVKVGFETVVI